MLYIFYNLISVFETQSIPPLRRPPWVVRGRVARGVCIVCCLGHEGRIMFLFGLSAALNVERHGWLLVLPHNSNAKTSSSLVSPSLSARALQAGRLHMQVLRARCTRI